MKTKYEVYEDNAGGLYLCILGEDGECIRIYDGWEYGHPENLLKAIRQLQEFPNDYEEWGPDLAEKVEEESQTFGFQPDTREDLYEILGDLIAYATYDGNLWLNERMGTAGCRALGVQR